MFDFRFDRYDKFCRSFIISFLNPGHVKCLQILSQVLAEFRKPFMIHYACLLSILQLAYVWLVFKICDLIRFPCSHYFLYNRNWCIICSNTCFCLIKVLRKFGVRLLIIDETPREHRDEWSSFITQKASPFCNTTLSHFVKVCVKYICSSSFTLFISFACVRETAPVTALVFLSSLFELFFLTGFLGFYQPSRFLIAFPFYP